MPESADPTEAIRTINTPKQESPNQQRFAGTAGGRKEAVARLDGLDVMSARRSRENRDKAGAQAAAQLANHSPLRFTDGAVTHRAFALCLTALLPRRVKL